MAPFIVILKDGCTLSQRRVIDLATQHLDYVSVMNVWEISHWGILDGSFWDFQSFPMDRDKFVPCNAFFHADLNAKYSIEINRTVLEIVVRYTKCILGSLIHLAWLSLFQLFGNFLQRIEIHESCSTSESRRDLELDKWFSLVRRSQRIIP